ncbi:hypothetical protein ES703_101461 [subsurface metagenome]
MSLFHCPLSNSFRKLGIVKAVRFNMIIRFEPVSITGELTPYTKSPVNCSRRRVTVNPGSRALPEHAVCSCPSGTLPFLVPVFIRQSLPINVYQIEQYTGRPSVNGSAVTKRQMRFALYKSIWTRCTIPNRKIVVPILGIATLKKD